MSRRRNRRNEENAENAVRGPSSALTSFLREQGINANAIRERYEERLRNPYRNHPQESIPEEGERTNEHAGDDNSSDENVYEDEEESEEVQRLREIARIKRRKANDHSDDVDADADADDDLDIEGKNYCMECDRDFIISVYSKRMEKDGRIGYLCPNCTRIAISRERLSKRNELEARKRRKKVSAALLNKQEFRIPSLQESCIKLITDNIDDVDILGDIGIINSRKISRILSKKRSLNSKTMTLFLDRSIKELEFWDCSKMDRDSLNKIGSFCPDLVTLNLNMCGQLHNDNLKYFGEKLKNLQYLSLNGPFLISDSMWQEFFDGHLGRNLRGFHIRNTHRFSSDSLVALLDNCGKNLESLTLSKLDGLTSKTVYDLLPHYLKNLKHLEISFPNSEELIDDELLINLLSVNGETLETLILDGCSGLTDEFLISGIRVFCPSLTKLSLYLLDQLTENGLVQTFTGWDINGGLMEINLARCTYIKNVGVYALLEHSSQTLVELNLNSLKDITKELFKRMSRHIRLPLLTTMDIGFVRSVDDSVLSILSRIAPKLKILEVYGNNKCSHKALVRDDLTILGRENDSL